VLENYFLSGTSFFEIDLDDDCEQIL